MKKLLALASTLLLAGLLTLGAADTKYFPGDYDIVLSKIPPPPSDDSVAGMADIETVLQVQRDRTPEQIERAKRGNTHTVMSMGLHLFGPDFTPKNLPKTHAILSKANKERSTIVHAGKRQWSRVRPYDRGLGVEPCLKRQIGDSYPSGHSSSGAFLATLYSAILPEYETLFADEMHETMWSRVLGGVHYPTDTQAGKLLGALIAQEMLKHPPMQADIKIIRAEILDFLKTRTEAEARAKQRLQR